MKFFNREIKEDIGKFKDTLLFYQNEGKWLISVFISIFEDDTELEANYSAVFNLVASFYQSGLTKKSDEFSKWNIYIIYICKGTVRKELKYKIENEKFSSRKIVEGNFSNTINSDSINKIIEKHITNTDLVLDSIDTKTLQLDYIPATDIWKLISENEQIKGDRNKQKDLLMTVSKIVNNEN